MRQAFVQDFADREYMKVLRKVEKVSADREIICTYSWQCPSTVWIEDR